MSFNKPKKYVMSTEPRPFIYSNIYFGKKINDTLTDLFVYTTRTKMIKSRLVSILLNFQLSFKGSLWHAIH